MVPVTGEISEGVKADDAALVTAAGDDVGAPVAAGKRMRPLPKEHVQWILSRKVKPLSGDLVTPEIAAMSKVMCKSFAEHQAWVRKELESNNGVIMVDEEENLAGIEWMSEFKVVFDSIDFSGATFGNCSFAFFMDEDESSEEEDEEEDISSSSSDESEEEDISSSPSVEESEEDDDKEEANNSSSLSSSDEEPETN